jgi:hypothetical protein
VLAGTQVRRAQQARVPNVITRGGRPPPRT